MNLNAFSRWLLVITLFSLTAAPADSIAQEAGAPANLFDRLEFRSIGPATMGGRVDDLAVLENRPSVFYVGAATGGLWKTTNYGTTWSPVFDYEEVSSIGAVAIPPGNPDLIWVGTGENNNRQSSSWGGGVYKSTNGGITWKNMGLNGSRHFGRIVIDPVNHDIVYAAAMGHLWGPNPERGVFKTEDGGLTWNRVLFVDENTGATDLVMDPSDRSVLYAATYERQRATWGFNGGGPGSGIYKTTDAGRTWKKLSEGIPAGPLGRIGLDIYRKDPRIVYALIEHEKESGLYRSGDAGAHWTKMSDVDPRPMYFSKVRIDPNDAHRIYVVGVRLMISDDEGRTFRQVRLSSSPGGGRPRDDMDVHAMWINPHDSSRLIIGADVGVAVSYDRGATWDYVDNLPIGQFYHIGYDMDFPYRVYGGLQDNDVWGGPSATRNRFGIRNRDWFSLAIGDGFAALPHPLDARVVYGETQNGNISRVDLDTYERQSIKPDSGSEEPPLRWAWDAPLIVSPHDPDTILTAANKVFRSTDRGVSWKAISPDLTSGVDRETLSLMGVTGKEIRISKNDGVSGYPTIVTLAESPKRAGLYYAGADDGSVHVSKDGGKTWTDISGKFPGLPARASARRLIASAFDEATAYATFNNHGEDDYHPYVYVTTDYGATWTSLSSTLPEGQTVDCITEDPRNPDVLYLGTEFGLFVTIDRGRDWIPLRSNLPTVPIDEIKIHPRENDMLLATHGRSIWILDDVTPIQQAAEAMKTSAWLFDLRRAVEFNPSNDFASYPGDRRFWGQNPEPGAAITYYLKDDSKDVRLVFRDAAGKIVREISGGDLKDARSRGLNRTWWDLRHQPVETFRGGSNRRPGGGMPGPFVLPGEYRVSLIVDGKDAGSRSMRVEGDPLIKISEADRRKYHDTALALHELGRSANEAARAISKAQERVQAVQDLLKQAAAPSPATVKEADAVSKRLAGLSRQLGGQGRRGFGGGSERPIRSQLSSVENQIMASTSVPTALQMQLAREGRDRLQKLITELNDVLASALPSLYKAVSAGKINPAPLKPVSLELAALPD